MTRPTPPPVILTPTPTSPISPSSSSSPTPPKPPRLLHRSPSEPVHLAPSPPHDSSQKSPQQVYVLSADGSSLFLIDPTRPVSGEEPPPYAPYTPSPASPRGRAPFPIVTTVGETSAHGRHRASTMSALPLPFPASSLGVSSRERRDRPTRPRYHSSHSQQDFASASHTLPRRSRSTLSSPVHTTSALPPDETTPLLPRTARLNDPTDEGADGTTCQRGFWRSVFCGELANGEEAGGWGAGWRRFWRVCGEGKVWWAMVHLWFLNFPFVSSLVFLASLPPHQNLS